ncbi:hypothetical protein Nepgr_020789 [Nepenthes gracilis]|uniref:Uncharacterized protein n=1 Tax=Nepenthes gracilis TaxID=150966 RepID=A0AAD3SVW9_NEPGR|nr:hypothetical protein Nepgr_020789 [Nepenthes gracilis]
MNTKGCQWSRQCGFLSDHFATTLFPFCAGLSLVKSDFKRISKRKGIQSSQGRYTKFVIHTGVQPHPTSSISVWQALPFGLSDTPSDGLGEPTNTLVQRLSGYAQLNRSPVVQTSWQLFTRCRPSSTLRVETDCPN